MTKLLTMLAMLVFYATYLQAQDRVITGKITDEAGSPISFASIKVKGSAKGTQTGSDGSFSITVPAHKGSLEISSVGFVNQVLAIGAGNSLKIILVKNTAALDEVVVTGYTAQKRASVTGAVASISGKDLEDLPVTNVGNLLQGKAAGVQVTAQNGAPGANAFIRIRGVGSLAAGSDPLFVIDGVAADTKQYNGLNADDIDNINILKDASSAAIYGARGANGVVLITTKKGKKGEPRIRFHTENGKQYRMQDNFKLMSIDQKLQYEYDLNYANYYFYPLMDRNNYGDIQSIPMDSVKAVWKQLESQKTDWFKVLMQNANYRKNEISIDGADEKFNYYVSVDNTYQDGLLKQSSFNRTGGRINLSYKAKDWLTVGTNTSFSTYKINALRDRYNAQNPYLAAYQINPYETEFMSDGKTYNPTSMGFPIAQAIYDNPASNRTNSAAGVFYAAVRPIKDLELKSQVGLNYIDYSSESYMEPGSYLDLILNPGPTGVKTDGGSRTFNYVWTNTANYQHSFEGGHHFSMLLGTEFTKNHFSNYSLTSQGFPSPNIGTQDVGATPLTTSSTKNDWSLFSLFAKPSYNYQEKYYVDASVRRDGSSRFGAGNRYGNFYSGGLGWDMAKEDFLSHSSWINQLKVRASAGSSGNFNIGNYNSLYLYNYGSYNGQSISKPAQLANANLGWEKQTAVTAGVDFSFFKSRLTGSVDYYHQNRDNLLQMVPLTSTVGFTSYLENLGAMTNKGWEFALSYDLIRTNDWKVNVGGNISFNQNKVTKLTGSANDNIPQPDGYTTLAVGQSYLTYYLVRSAGVDPQTGHALYYDNNNKATDQFGSYTQILKGKSPLPKYYGGFNASATYKSITLSTTATFSGGNYIYNGNYENAMADGLYVSSEMSVDALNYWKKPGDKVANPAPVANNGNYHSTDKFLQKGDYVRLRDVTLSYSLPKNILDRTKVIKGVQVYVVGHNLLTYRPYYKGDPEVGIGSTESDPTSPVTGSAYINGVYSLYSYPNYRAWTVGLTVTF